jgi:16S rRNA G966 N2-methylase RsmD
MLYYIQFPAGTQSLVISALAGLVKDADVTYKDESALILETAKKLENAASLPFASNVFQVLSSTHRGAIPKSIRQVIARLDRINLPKVGPKDPGFRLMVNIDGELVAIDRDIRAELELELTRRTNGKVQSRGSGREYWILGRKHLDTLLFCLRLPKAAPKTQPKGALAPELAALLVLASNPEKGDVFLDPFAGSGAIVEARLKYPYRAVTFSDLKRQVVAPAILRRSKTDRRVRLMQADALDLEDIGEGEVDVIVSDPPWGEFEKLPMPHAEFAAALASSFHRLLDPVAGRFVLLVTRKQADMMVDALKRESFRMHATHRILVNGHPASVIIGSR